MNKPIMDEEDAAAEQYSGQQLYRILDANERVIGGDIFGKDGLPVTAVGLLGSTFTCKILRPVSAATPESRWRDVDENTPRDGTHIIGKDADGNSHVVYRSPSSNCWLTAGAWHRVEITRWMPIPTDEESLESRQGTMSKCVTHHFACDCREKLFEEAMQTRRNVVWLQQASDQELMEMCGKLSRKQINAIHCILEVCLRATTAP